MSRTQRWVEVRAFTPVILWITTLLIQQWIWTTYLTEIFEGPPR